MTDFIQQPAVRTPNLAAALASTYGNMGAVPAIIQSQYLADAIERMAQTGDQNIRTPLAFGSKLAASVLNRIDQNRINQKLIAAAQGGINSQAGQFDNLNPAPTPASDAGTPPAAAPTAGIATPQPPVATSQAPAAAPTPAQRLASSVDGKGFFDGFWAPHEGALNPRDANGSPDYFGINAKANALTGPISRDQAQQLFADRYWGPSGAGALAATNPGLAVMAADTYGLNPGWERRAMATSGGDPTKFMAARQALEQSDLARNPNVRPYANAWANRDRDLTTYAGNLGFAQSSPASANQSTSSADQTTPVPRPFQVSTGPDPSIGSAGAFGPSGASPAPTSVPPLQPGTIGNNGPAAPQGASGPGVGQPGWQAPSVPITQAQLAELGRRKALALQYPQNPGYWQAYTEFGNALEAQKAGHDEVTATLDRQSGQMVLVGKSGRVYGAVAPPGGMIPAQTLMPTPGQPGGPGPASAAPGQPPTYGGLRPLTDPQARAAYGISANDRAVYMVGPDNKPVKVADAPFSFGNATDLMKNLTGSTQYETATKATEMYRSAINAAGRAGGIPDAQLVDFAAQEMSGGVARQFNQKMIAEGQGPWQRLQQFAPELISGQKLSPAARQALLQSMHDYATEAQLGFSNLARSTSAQASAGGFDVSPFVSPLMAQLPDVPNVGGIPNGMSGAGGPGPHAAIGPGSQGWPPGVPATGRQADLARQFIAKGHVWDPRIGDWR